MATHFEKTLGQIRLDYVNAGWLIFGDGFNQGFGRTGVKRVFDMLCASAAAGAGRSGDAAITAILIKLESRGPLLYRQERVGQNGKTFEVCKFRSMRTDAEKDGLPVWATANDSRVTRVGAVIRKLRIDELPQLFNVLKGEMSLVGPRPERPFFRRAADGADPLLCGAPQREARRHRLGTGALPVRLDGRGFAGEAAVRPVLRQEPLAVPGHHHPVRNGLRGLDGQGRPLSVPRLT
jgi:hypothetical protein